MSFLRLSVMSSSWNLFRIRLEFPFRQFGVDPEKSGPLYASLAAMRKFTLALNQIPGPTFTLTLLTD